jgi:hypothetical protein
VEPLDARLGEDALALMERWSARTSTWQVRAASELVDVKGRAVVVPDLVLTHESGFRVLVEVMGFSSRDAVFARVALAESGALPPMIFCASDRLRVSEALLPEDASASLLVYKARSIPVTTLEEKLERLRRVARGN